MAKIEFPTGKIPGHEPTLIPIPSPELASKITYGKPPLVFVVYCEKCETIVAAHSLIPSCDMDVGEAVRQYAERDGYDFEVRQGPVRVSNCDCRD